MKINDVDKLTGLTQKAIRLYESKGLLQVARDENGYRNYSHEDISTLKTIKLLRSAGISIADIKLYLSDVITMDEVLDKRKAEILKESGANSEKYRLCEMLSQGKRPTEADDTEPLSEGETIRTAPHGALSAGIDIGTTTISAVVYDTDRKEQIEVYSIAHGASLPSDVFAEQDVAKIMDKSEKLLRHILRNNCGIVSIGLSGQMHGIVYIDGEGQAISNLMNWQDKRADQPSADGETACEQIRKITGQAIATGYGLATHYYNLQHGLVPAGAATFCSIVDYFGMKICGLSRPLLHTSMAASFGLFDTQKGQFLRDKIALLGIPNDFLPAVTDQSRILGHCEGIPVSVGLGDNQAGFLGSVQRDDECVLVNIGTGSQVSVVSEYTECNEEIELRPYVGGKYLLCGSALCGGSAYAMLESFFRSYAVSAGSEDTSQYGTLNRLASNALQSNVPTPEVDVCFYGKRSDPHRRGAIHGIDRGNFTPEALVLGVLKGMCAELYELYEGFSQKKSRVVASGGAVRKCPVLKQLLEQRFGMAVTVHNESEEAATGAALFAAMAQSFATKELKP